MKKEELKNRLEELKESKKIVVGVEQWKDNNKKELVNILEDEKNNIMQLLGFLYSKTIIKVSNLKISYSYNYSDLQTSGYLDTYKLGK